MNTIEALIGRSRPLPLALAHCMVSCKPGRDGERLDLLNRIFRLHLSPAGQLQCRDELRAIRAARWDGLMRGQV